jgi:hypothetical protein
MLTARPGLPRFQGPFKTFSVSYSTNRESGIDSRLLVYSQGSRAKVQEYLWLKYLWDELTRLEMELFLIMPETLNSEMKFATLRVALLKPKKWIRTKLSNCPFLEEKERPLKLRYQGFKRLDVEIHRITRSLPKVPKFSGWIRSSSAVGTKRPGGPSFLEPLAIIENDYTDYIFDWFDYLLSENNLFTHHLSDNSP